MAVTKFLRDGGQIELSAGRGILYFASGHSNSNLGSSRVDVGDGGMFTEVNAAGSSFSNTSVAIGDRSWSLSGCQVWVLDVWATGGE